MYDGCICSIYAGSIPSGPTPAEQLVPLTRIEENLVSRYRVHRNLYVMKPASWSWSATGTQQLCHQAHVIATPNTGPDMIRDCLLAHPDSLSDTLQVVFLVLVESNDPNAITNAVRKMVERSPALRIRGREVVKWAMHLSKVSSIDSNNRVGTDEDIHRISHKLCLVHDVQVYKLPPPSDEIVKAYSELTTLPESVLNMVLVAQTETDAATLVRTYLGADRVGPANTHQNDPDALYTQAMAGPDAVPPKCPTSPNATDGFGK